MSLVGLSSSFLTFASGAASPIIGNLFATHLYTGTGATNARTTGIDVASGGAIWTKARSTTTDHTLISTAIWSSGDNAVLYPNQNYARQGYADHITAIGATGHTYGTSTVVNNNGTTYASWAFKKAPRFFDCGVYTGNGASQKDISHALTVEPAMVMVKGTASATDWYVYILDIYTRGYTTYYVKTNSDTFFLNDSTIFAGVRGTSSVFSVGSNAGVNSNGNAFAWFAWAHDPAADGVCVSGGYTGNGSGSGPTVTLGWEPQMIMIKSIGGNGDWVLVDSTRGFTTALLSPNSTASESTQTVCTASGTGFTLTTGDSRVNASSGNYSYIAIRKP